MTKINPLKYLLIISLLCSFHSFAQLQFTENKGQWDKQVNFKTDLTAGAFYVERNGFTILQHNVNDLEKLNGLLHGEQLKNITGSFLDNNKMVLRSNAVKVKFTGATVNPQIVAGKPLPGYNNYFIGNDKSKWQGDCKMYAEVICKNVYPNIDVRYYINAGNIKYDFLVHPGGDVNAIALRYDGINKIFIQNGELKIITSVDTITEAYPYSYQLIGGQRKKVACSYAVNGNEVKFKVPDYAAGSLLVIDPTLIFSSFTGSTNDNWGNTATPGPDGSFFSGGIVFGNGYPVSAGAFDQTYNGGVDEDNNGPYDIAIFKFSSDGANRLYATYLGGTGNEQPESMICDAAGNLIVMARTNSANYPRQSLAGSGGGYDIGICKFNNSGTALLGSIVIGGSADDGLNIKGRYTPVNPPSQADGAFETRRNYGDDNRGELLLDNNNNVYVASCTQSSNFPVIASVIQPAFSGGRQDGIIMKLQPNLSAITFSTFFGGTGSDACFALALNKATGNLYVAGATTSTDLPGNKISTIAAVYQGGATDGFITMIKADGSSIVKTSYEGTAGNDMIYCMQLDDNGNPYITGSTTGNRPVINAAFSQQGGKQFISKLQPDLSGYVYSTNFGTNAAVPNISTAAFHVDKCQNVYVSGWGGTFNSQKGYPCAGTNGLTVTNGAIQSTTDGKDFYLFVMSRDATSQLYGSFFGQAGGFDDHTDGGTNRFDANGVLYQSICANCGAGVGFPTTPGVWSPTNLSSGCNQAAVKINMNFERTVSSGIKATIGGVAKDTGCLPLTVVFTDTVTRAKKYSWNFGDGSAEVSAVTPVNTVSHIFSVTGRLRVRLIATDSATCNITDTSYFSVTVNDCSGNSFCAADNIYLGSSINGTNFQWQVNTGTGFFNISNNATYSGTNSKILQLVNAPTSWYGYQYRCVVDAAYSDTSTLKFVNYWIGAVNNTWENPANWSCGKLPDAYTDVFINAGVPVLNSNTAIRTLSVGPGVDVVINPGYNLQINH